MDPLYLELIEDIKSAYEEGISLDKAERLASKFLYAQTKLAEELRVLDLDAKMRKSGLKALKGALYINEVGKHDKKPSDIFIEQKINSDDIVQKEQNALDEAEVMLNKMQNYFNIFKDGHIHMRGVSKGKFE